MAKYFCKVMKGGYCNTFHLNSFHIRSRYRGLRLTHQTVDKITLPQQNLIREKLEQLVLWYENITGMDEVRIAQNRVLEAEGKFISAQDRRREANKQVALIQNKLKEVYAELDNTTRGEDRYVHLITEEHKLLKEERQIVAEFQRLESEEREYFSALSSAVKESHEKERAQAERTKYWSIIGSILGTVIGVVGSSINNHLKMKELKKLVTESMLKAPVNTNSSVGPDVLLKHEKELSSIVSEMKTAVNIPGNDALGRLNELIHVLDAKVNIEKEADSDMILRALQELKKSLDLNLNEMRIVLRSESSKQLNLSDQQLMIVPYEFEAKLKEQRHQITLIVSAAAVIFMAVPVIFKYFGIS